ncbi:MAG: hypothetical protein FD143_3734, partial [Ignavibacteria bacterium]
MYLFCMFNYPINAPGAEIYNFD